MDFSPVVKYLFIRLCYGSCKTKSHSKSNDFRVFQTNDDSRKLHKETITFSHVSIRLTLMSVGLCFSLYKKRRPTFCNNFSIRISNDAKENLKEPSKFSGKCRPTQNLYFCFLSCRLRSPISLPERDTKERIFVLFENHFAYVFVSIYVFIFWVWLDARPCTFRFILVYERASKIAYVKYAVNGMMDKSKTKSSYTLHIWTCERF